MDIKKDFYQVNDKLQQMIADELQNAYTKGYEAGYADASNGAPNQLTQPDDFVKALNDTDCYGLGLPSGTMWGVVEGYKVTYDLASKYDIPTETQLYELIACCDLMTLINGIRLSGPKGYLTIHADSAEDTLGCILVGENKAQGRVINSRIWEGKLMDELKKVPVGQKIVIHVH